MPAQNANPAFYAGRIHRIRGHFASLIRSTKSLMLYFMELLCWILLGALYLAAVVLCLLIKLCDWIYGLVMFMAEPFIQIMNLLVGLMNLCVIYAMYCLYRIYYGW